MGDEEEKKDKPKGKKEDKEKEKISNENSKRGKSNRAKGQRFEAKVRQNLEEMGWIVGKWVNTVDYEKGKIVPAKRKYNPFSKVLTIGTGFPDFICFKRNVELEEDYGILENKKESYEVIGVEVKANGYLDQIEKGMCFWILENKIFSRILIAKKSKEGKQKEIEYIDFKEKYNKQKVGDKGKLSSPIKKE